MLHIAHPSARSLARVVSLSLCLALLATLAPPPSGAAAGRGTLPPAGAAAARRAEGRPGELLVRFRDGVAEREREAVVGARGGHRRGALRGASGVERVGVPSTRPLELVAAELAALPAVEYAEPNYIIRGEQAGPADPHFAEQWALRNTGQRGGTPGSDVGAEGAWRNVTGSRQTVVAVVDSGVDFTHPDLANNAWSNPREIENGRDDDRNGYADDLRGWDWVARSGYVTDPNGHGTAVAGIIAAEGNNGTGVAGVMWQSSLMSLRVLDETGTGDVAAAVEALDYAVEHGASVVNLSWGTGGESRALRDAILRAGRRGVLVVCSAGNAGRNIDAEPYYPASYDLPNVLAVAASDNTDRMAAWSNWGAQAADVAAPGSDILTTQPGGGYRLVSGTSAAAPVASGVAGLVRSLHPTLGAEGVRSAVAGGARKVAGLEGVVAGGGVVSAPGALDAAGRSVSGGGGGNDDGNGNDGGNGPGGGHETGGGAGGGGGHGQSPLPGSPGRGSGGRGPGGSFDVDAPRPTREAPGGAVNLDEARKLTPHRPKAPTFVSADLMPVCDVDCGGVEPPGGAGGSDPYFGTGRTRPENETGRAGVDLGSRNFSWSLPLVNLAGRAGLDLSVGLNYNSLVWTKQGRTLQFNGDHGFPGPGFRLGFPTLQPQYFDSDSGAYAYMMVTASGGRVEMRQVSTNVYESADSTYTQLTFDASGNPVVRTTDGAQLRFVYNASQGEYRCTEIKDRNGNYITINYDPNTTPGAWGRPTSVVDTLGRTLTFNYDGNHYLASITQTWRRDTPSGQVTETHTWATFGYGLLTMQTNFADQFGAMGVVGPANGAAIPVLTSVGLPDGSSYHFEYNSWGQVYRINHKGADGHVRARTAYNLPANASTPQSDCPRFTERRDWAEYWNGDTGDGVIASGEEAVTTFSAAADGSWTLLTPPDPTPSDPSDNVVYKEYFATSGWQKGLTLRTEAYHPSNPSSPMKWTTTSWTQDDTSLPYAKNPRTEEVNVYDGAGNRRRTRYQYSNPFGLLAIVYEYAADGASLLRQTNFAYDLNPVWVDRRIIGLMTAREVYDVSTGSYVLASRTTYTYDSTPLANPGAVARHDDAAYGANFQLGRANLTAVHRFNTGDPYNVAAASATTTGYDTAGSVVWEQDASGHRTNISYADAFTDGVNRSTFAYPTAMTDPDNHAGTKQYNYDMGVLIRTVDPKGAEQKTFYDAAGRVEREVNVTNGAYSRRVYSPASTYVLNYTTVSGAGEAYLSEFYDGAGRLIRNSAYHAGSAGGYRAWLYEYDALGRSVRKSNPTEIDGGWTPAGDDAGGYQWTAQAYDWQGRPTVTTHPTGNTVEATYGGCGCAGGDVMTVRDERGRRKRYTKDVLGRLSKVEELNWDTSVYSTTTYAYNALDQIKRIDQAGQVRTLDYDGHGRLWKRTTPEQGTTEYAYNPDDTVNWMKDARGVKAVFGYNNRDLLTSISYDLSQVAPGQNVAATAPVTMGYDAAGNRTSMTDGLGSVSYSYDTLSRLSSETRTFTQLQGSPYMPSGSVTLSYGYNLSGQVTSMYNSWNGVTVGYQYDVDGRLSAVTGAGYAGVTTYASNLQYRAFDALKGMSYNNGRALSAQYDSRLRLTRWNVAGVNGFDYFYDNAANPSWVLWDRAHRVTYARNLYDPSLDRSFDYDHLGRLQYSHSGVEARMHVTGQPNDGGAFGPYAHHYGYDKWGNVTSRAGWGGANASYSATFTNNRRDGHGYDAAGNVTSDGGQSFAYDATGQQTYASGTNLGQAYDGDGLRAKKTENGSTIYYLRSTALGSQVVCEINQWGGWHRGYVYAGSQLLALQFGGVYYAHQDPVAKSQRVTDGAGNVVSAVELDPWGGETSRSNNSAFQPQRFTSYIRDANESDDAMMRRYNRWWSRFDQPDPYEGSYDLADPQSFNRYSYAQNDPVNFTDPSGQFMCSAQFSFSDCGGWAGIIGGYYGDDYAYEQMTFGGMSSEARAGLALHLERVSNAQAGYGFLTNAQVSAGLAESFSMRYTIYSDGSVEIEQFHLRPVEVNGSLAWHQRGWWGDTSLRLEGFANALTFDLPNRINRAMGRIGDEGIEWLRNDPRYQRGETGGMVAGIIVPGPGKLGAAAKAAKITFSLRGHGARHLAGTGLSRRAVERAIRADVRGVAGNASATGAFWGRVTVGGKTVEYRAFTLPNGRINIGTYYVP